MADYKLVGEDDSYGIWNNLTNQYISNSTRNKDWLIYQDWLAVAGNVPDPKYTAEEQALIDYNQRQDNRIRNLKGALVDQFKMILELFQVGRDKGLWVVGDFEPELVTKAQEWIALIDDYETDEPYAEI